MSQVSYILRGSPGRLATGAVLLATTMVACADDPLQPGLDGGLPDVPASPTAVFRGIDPGQLHRLDRESELGHPSDGDAGLRLRLLEGFSGRGEGMDATARTARSLDGGSAAGFSARRLNLDIPEVCHRDSPALDFQSGWIFFDDDCDAMLAARDELRGTVALNWDTATVMTEWDGVVLGTFGVERLYLHNRGLDGSLPPELGALTDIEVLSLGRNRLTGAIPPELGSIRDLERLYLWRNQLTGGIPPELGSISLERLELWENELTGPIPEELGDLNNLETLSLSRNGLTGEIPPGLADLRDIEALWLDGNELTGPIPTPDRSGAWEHLEVLWLDGNALSGPVPAELGDTDLHSLAIRNNAGLTGPLPLELQSLILDAFHWDGTGLCSPDDPSFQAWLGSIASADGGSYSGGPVCDSDSGGGSDDYKTLTGFTITASGALRWGNLTNSGCVNTSRITVNGVNYEVHWTEWQRRDAAGSAWAQVSGTRRNAALCGYDLAGARAGVYRFVGEFTVDGVRGRYKSENEVTVGGSSGNRAPETVGSIPARTLEPGESATVDASDRFRDPDGDALTYSARSSRTGVATVSVSGSTVTVTGVADGSATIRVTARDPGGLTAEQAFDVTVAGGGSSDDYKPITGLTITASGALRWSILTTSGCVSTSGIRVNGVDYEVHWTEWQRRDRADGSPWAQVPGTRRNAALCGYDLSGARAGVYRFVGEFSVGGVRGKYKSENEITR